MRLLYDDKLAPMTSEIGFLHCAAEMAARECTEWFAEIGTRVTGREVLGQLDEVLASLLPLTGIMERRTLFVPTKGKWTAYFDNGWQGPDVESRVGYLHKRIGCRGVRAVCTPHTMRKEGQKWKGRWGATILSVFSPDAEDSLGCERFIYAMNDGGRWDFEEYGERYEFEDIERYERKKVRDRFTPEMLDAYLRHMGIHAFDEAFYVATKDNPAILLEVDGPPARDMREYTLAEARADY